MSKKDKNPLRFYVYAYLRSKDSETAKASTPYYIGKGQGNRAYYKHRSNLTPKDKSNIIFISENMSDNDALKLEIELIKHYGRVDNGTGILRNLTNGGDGVSGVLVSSETRKLLSEIGKHREFSILHRQRLSAAAKISSMKRPPQSAETRAKKSESSKKVVRKRGNDNPLTGRKRPEHSIFMKEYAKNNKRERTPEQNEANRQRMLGTKASKETKEKQSRTRRNKSPAIYILDYNILCESIFDAAEFLINDKKLKRNIRYVSWILTKNTKILNVSINLFGINFIGIPREVYNHLNKEESINVYLTSLNLDKGTGHSIVIDASDSTP